jgi:hypothetical protein
MISDFNRINILSINLNDSHSKRVLHHSSRSCSSILSLTLALLKHLLIFDIVDCFASIKCRVAFVLQADIARKQRQLQRAGTRQHRRRHRASQTIVADVQLSQCGELRASSLPSTPMNELLASFRLVSAVSTPSSEHSTPPYALFEKSRCRNSRRSPHAADNEPRRRLSCRSSACRRANGKNGVRNAQTLCNFQSAQLQSHHTRLAIAHNAAPAARRVFAAIPSEPLGHPRLLQYTQSIDLSRIERCAKLHKQCKQNKNHCLSKKNWRARERQRKMKGKESLPSECVCVDNNKRLTGKRAMEMQQQKKLKLT